MISVVGSVAGWFRRRRQRSLFLLALAAGVVGATGATLVLGNALTQRFASQVEADLEWRAVRGARELSMTTERDRALINEALGAYAASPDVRAIAVEVGDRRAASRGTVTAIAPVFAARPGTLVHGADYVASWAAAVTDGAEVGKIAVVMSTQRLTDARAMRRRVLQLILIAGGAAAILGAVVVLWLTRNARAGDRQDVDADDGAAPLPAAGGAIGLPGSAPPASLPEQVEDLTHELEDRNRGLQMILEHAAQGFVTVELSGRMASERSAVLERWFGSAPAGTTLADYVRPYGADAANQLALGLERICAGELSLDECLTQLPKRLAADGQAFQIKYVPILRDGRPEGVLLVMTDISELVAREQAEQLARERRELSSLSRLISEDRASFDEFFAEAAGFVASLDAPSDPEVERRTMRSLKDSCAYYGLDTYVALCEAVELAITESETALSDEQRIAVAAGWARLAGQLASLLA